MMHEFPSDSDSQMFYEPRIPFTGKDVTDIVEIEYLIAERLFLLWEISFFRTFKIFPTLQDRINIRQELESEARAKIQAKLIATHFPYLEEIANIYPEFSLRDYIVGALPWRKKTDQELHIEPPQEQPNPRKEKKPSFLVMKIRKTIKREEHVEPKIIQDVEQDNTEKKETYLLSLYQFTADISPEYQALFPKNQDGEFPQYIEDIGGQIPSLMAYTLKHLNLIRQHVDTSVIVEDGRTFQDVLDEEKMQILQRFVALGFWLGAKQKLLSQEDFALYQKLSRDKRGLLGNGEDPESKISAREWLEHFYDTHDMEVIPEDIREDLSRFFYYRARSIQHCSRIKRRHVGVEVRQARTPQQVIFEDVMEFQQTKKMLQEKQIFKMDESSRGVKRMFGEKLDKNDLIELLEEQADWLYRFCAAPVNHKWVGEGKKEKEITIPIGLSEVIEKVRERETILFGRTSQIIETFYGTKKKKHRKKGN